MSELKARVKPFEISKWLVWEAWEKVRANQGAPGVDGQSLSEFEKDLKNNLFKIWNRMSSGSYFPPPVRMVEIPKQAGGVRVLGVPTVADRVAQTVVAMELETRAEPVFVPDSYGYRPRRGAIDAVRACRARCWKYDWVIDLDIKAFFDSVPWDLVLAAVEAVCDLPWVRLYVTRWLQAPLQHPDGRVVERTRGTPQGSAVSPVLANLFMHYAFDTWLGRRFPGVVFERYADDAVIHCRSLAEATTVLAGLEARMGQVGLVLHPDKTRIVYCKDANRTGSFEQVEFTFLGKTFNEKEYALYGVDWVRKNLSDEEGKAYRKWQFRQSAGGQAETVLERNRAFNLTVIELILPGADLLSAVTGCLESPGLGCGWILAPKARLANKLLRHADELADVGRVTGRQSRRSRSCAGGAHSFAPDTLVLMADGSTKPIADVEPGDKILASDPATGQESAETVTAVWVHTDTLIGLQLATDSDGDGHLDTIRTTPDHPFWNATDRQWQPATAIDTGEHLLTPDGDTIPIHRLNPQTTGKGAAYNLTVTGPTLTTYSPPPTPSSPTTPEDAFLP